MNVIHLVFALFFLTAPVQAQDRLGVVGKLTTAQGQGLSGMFLLNFSLAGALEGGEAVWREGRYVKVLDGDFSTVLGDKSPIPADLREEGYRLKFDPPSGTGWAAYLEQAPRWVTPASEPQAETEAAQIPSQVSVSAPQISASEIVGAQAKQMRAEVLQYKRRIEALEDAVQKTVPVLKPEVNIYVVKSHDTLRGIAKALYGNSDHWVDIYRANSDRIRRGGELVPGQRLLIPKVSPY